MAADIHVLVSGHANRASAVVHVGTPAGSNKGGFAWKDVFLAAGVSGKTALSVGTGPGQITTAESTSIISGDLLEFAVEIPLTPNQTPAQRLAEARQQAASQAVERLQRLQDAYDFYGISG